jgi:hypothetical protein
MGLVLSVPAPVMARRLTQIAARRQRLARFYQTAQTDIRHAAFCLCRLVPGIRAAPSAKQALKPLRSTPA